MAWIKAAALLMLTVGGSPAWAQRSEKPEQGEALANAERTYQQWVTPTLTPFRNDSEFRRYLRDLNAYRRAYHASGAGDGETIVVTGSIMPANPTITNNQEAGVEEGDIVKQVGQFLLVLQDGRIFSIDTRGGSSRRELVLADRANVYRSSAAGTWYDEMLVTGNRILVTGYSYDDRETALAVFRLDERGRLATEGVFTIHSYDYYDTENYATRLIGDRLVVYTPISPQEMNDGGTLKWPLIRRWRPGHDPADDETGRKMIDVRDVYRPLRMGSSAIIHAVSVCPLGPLRPGRDLSCETRGFIAPGDREFYVSNTHAYMWVTDDEEPEDQQSCASDERRPLGETYPALLYRVPLSNLGEPAVAGVRGDPINQFSLQTSGGRFRALIRTPSIECEYEAGWPLSYVTLPLSAFSPQLHEAPDRAYAAIPVVSGISGRVENRFTDTHLVYGGRTQWGGVPTEDRVANPGPVYALPIDRPGEVRSLQVRHNIHRVERAGVNVVLTGYQDMTGLDVTLLDLSGTPRIASTTRVIGRFESEGRSHAFNSLIEADGSGLMGIPTVERRLEEGIWQWRSSGSDVSYLSVDAAGQIESLGALETGGRGPWRDDFTHSQEGEVLPNGYTCEVSCIDWYGNSRPIFTDGRVFGLTGTELIEGRVTDGRIEEVQRLDLTVPPAR